MTFLTTRYRFSKVPTAKDFEHLGRLTTIYGIHGITFEDQDLIIDYDASRIHEAEVLAAVRRAGVSVVPPEPIPLGGYDRTGEFRDFAWPTEGLSPVNKNLK
jgi:hypothetical protein